MTESFNCISALVTVAMETAKLTVAMELESMGPLNRTLTLLTSCLAPTLLMVGCAIAIGPLRPTRAAAKSVFAITLRLVNLKTMFNMRRNSEQELWFCRQRRDIRRQCRGARTLFD